MFFVMIYAGLFGFDFVCITNPLTRLNALYFFLFKGPMLDLGLMI